MTAANNNWYGPNALPPIASDITIEGNGATILRHQVPPSFRFFYVGADRGDPDSRPRPPHPPRPDAHGRPRTGRRLERRRAGPVSAEPSSIRRSLVIERSTLVQNSAEVDRPRVASRGGRRRRDGDELAERG